MTGARQLLDYTSLPSTIYVEVAAQITPAFRTQIPKLVSFLHESHDTSNVTTTREVWSLDLGVRNSNLDMYYMSFIPYVPMGILTIGLFFRLKTILSRFPLKVLMAQI